MGNKIFDTILLRKIENFVSTFGEDSKSIFFNGNKLRHAGEFGKYRENSLKDLLQILTRYRISDGFIITSKNNTSTQCDIVVYDNFDFPILENNLAQFFSIESVITIGEVKSTLSRLAFKNALIKLSENKKLSEDIQGAQKQEKKYGNEFDAPISFLVCKNLRFDVKGIDFSQIYGDIPKKYWHNMILVIDKGFYNYQFNFQDLNKQDKKNHISNNRNVDVSTFWQASQMSYGQNTYDCQTYFMKVEKNDKYKHIKMFLTAISSAISVKTLYHTEIIHYLGYPAVNIRN